MVNLRKFNKEDFGKKLIPNKIYNFEYKNEFRALYEKLYFNNLNYPVFTNLFALSIMANLVLYFFIYDYVYQIKIINDYFYVFFWKIIIIFVLWFISNLTLYYLFVFFYYFIHESRFKKNETEIEKDLPEFIDNLVSNLKGGISLEKALMKSVRPEQKALMSEIALINQKVMMGKTVDQSLKEFRLRFDSQIINRTIFLIEEGIKCGGNLAAPLERISENLKRIYNLDSEIKANSGGFSVVIMAITLIVSPLLFSLALTLLTFIGNLFQLILKSGSDVISVSEIPPEFSDYLVIFSYSMIILITFFSSMIIAELKGEKIHNSIKYLPFYIIFATIVFNIISKLLLSFFGNVI